MLLQIGIDFAKKVGFHLASSSFLAKRMISQLDFSELSTVIELGAGEGMVTKEILKKVSPQAQLHIFEIESDKIQKLHDLYGAHPQVIIHHSSAAYIDQIFPENSVDAIISTLPLGSISRPGVHHILKSIFTVLKEKGHYIQYQYWMVNRKDVKRFFHMESTVLEPRNSCPAWIYRARKLKSSL